MATDPGKIVNNELAKYRLVDRDGSMGVSVNDHFDISIFPDNGYVVVTGITNTKYSLSVTVKTLEDHPDAGTNTFSVSYNPEKQQLTWSTHNVSRSNDAASFGIVSGLIDARSIQQQQ